MTVDFHDFCQYIHDSVPHVFWFSHFSTPHFFISHSSLLVPAFKPTPQRAKLLIGAGLSEPPHKWVCCRIYLYHTLCHKLLPALFCAFLHHLLIQETIHKLLSEKTWTVYLLDGNSKDGDHSWTHLFNGQSDRGYRMVKMFYLSMPLFALSLTVEVTCHMDWPLQWPHRWGLPHVIKDSESATSV